MNKNELKERLRHLSLNTEIPGQPINVRGVEPELLNKFFDTGILDENILMDPSERITFTVHPCFMAVAEHYHSFIELIYVYSGECQQRINGKDITMKQGEVCILDTNVTHSIHDAGEDDIIVNCLMKKSYFDTAFLSRLSGNDVLSSFFVQSVYQSKEFNEFILFPSGKNEKIQQLIGDLLCEFFDPGLCSEEVINSYMILLFTELLRIYKEDLQDQSRQSLRNATIAEILLYIQKEYRTATLKSTARYFHFHPNYLSSVIKKLTGRNFLDILHELKLKNASMLLSNSELSMRDVCQEVGYNNLSFFYKLFKNRYGITPANYRGEMNKIYTGSET